MKRPESHTLEDESRVTFLNLLPRQWIHRDKNPDYGLDMEIEIVEGEEVTNKVLWVQMKATNTDLEEITYQMQTNHLIHYEGCRLPVVIVYWVKPKNRFYYVFAQKCIETLSQKNPRWREQKTVKVHFDTYIVSPHDLEVVATEGYFYVLQKQLNIESENSAVYWLDGIPQSDDRELKKRTLQALICMEDEKYSDAINEIEKTLRVCTVSPTERMALLLNLGNAYYSLSRHDDALKNYEALLEINAKVDEESALEGKSAALGNIGIIYRDKGDLDEALTYHKAALEIDREVGYRQGEANQLGNIGIIYRDKGDLDEALTYHKAALEIDREIGYRQGEASDLGNIGIIYRDKGDLDEALTYHKAALEIDREVGYRQGEANQLGNIGIIYRDKGDLDEALTYHKAALEIDREIGYRQGEASDLGNIGLIYGQKGDFKKALTHLKEALAILDQFNLVYGRDIICDAIDLIKNIQDSENHN